MATIDIAGIETGITYENAVTEFSRDVHDMKERLAEYANDPHHNPELLKQKTLIAARFNRICNIMMGWEQEMDNNQLTDD